MWEQMSNHREQLIQQWVHIDQRQKQLNDELRELRRHKTDINARLTQLLVEQHITAVPTSEGELKLIKKHNYENLTFKYLEATLPTIIADSSQTKKLIQALRDKRTIHDTYELTWASNNGNADE